MLIGIDIGTSGAKAALMREDGTVLATHQENYDILSPRPGWAEQDPELWLGRSVACLAAMAAAAKEQGGGIHGVAFSGQMHSFALAGKDGLAVGNAIIWADARTGGEVREIPARLGPDRFHAITLNRLAAGFGLASLSWLRRNMPEVLAKTRYAVCPKDYVRSRLAGAWGQDLSDASATCCLDQRRGDWAWEMLKELDIPTEIFPPLSESVARAGGLAGEFARATGLPEGLPLFYGGADSAMAGIGAGLVEEGAIGVNIGTGGQVAAVLDRARYDPEYRTSTVRHAIPGKWILQGATLSAGLSLKWFRNACRGDLDFPELSRMAATVPPGSEGLLFLPYLTGERTPWFDADARGIFAGLSVRHGTAEMARAVMEGVTLALEQGYAIVREAGADGRRIIASGGGARSPAWLQMQADVFGLPVRAAAAGDACVGAAVVAGVGAGVYPDVRTGVERAVGAPDSGGEVYRPDPKRHEFYQRLRQSFRQLYLNNREWFREIPRWN